MSNSRLLAVLCLLLSRPGYAALDPCLHGPAHKALGAPSSALRATLATHLLAPDVIDFVAGSSSSPKIATSLSLRRFRDHTQGMSVEEKVQVWKQFGDKIEARHRGWKSEGPFTVPSADELEGLAGHVDPAWLSGAQIFYGVSGYGLAIRSSDAQVFVGFLKTSRDRGKAVKTVDYSFLETLDEHLDREDKRISRGDLSGAAQSNYNAAWLPKLERIGSRDTVDAWRTQDHLGRPVEIHLLPPALELFEGAYWSKAVAIRNGRRIASLHWRVHANGALGIEGEQTALGEKGAGLELALVLAIYASVDHSTVREVYTYDHQSIAEYPEQRLRDLWRDLGQRKNAS